MITHSRSPDISHDNIEITHPDGIHIRPAHAILVFANDVEKELGIRIHIGKPANDIVWRDIIQENEMAKNGFGLQYAAFLNLMLMPGDTMAVKYEGTAVKKHSGGVSNLLRALLEDVEALENGARVEHYAVEYLARLKELADKKSSG